jgi:hypothetical protein
MAELPFAAQLQHRIPYFGDWSPFLDLASMLDVLLIAASLYALLRWYRHGASPRRRAVAEWTLLLLAVISLNQLRRHVLPFGAADLWTREGPRGASVFPGLRVLAVISVLPLLWAVRNRRTQVVRFALAGFFILSPFALWGLGRAIVESARSGPAPTFAGRSFTLASFGTATDAASPRVVIALFDMADYGVAFARRPESLELPAFDALSRAALVATNAVSPGDHTVPALPSLITGAAVDSALPIAPARLRLFRHAREPQVWGEAATLFSEAKRRGVTTSVVGWYLPYCTTFGKLLVSCWTPPTATIRSLPAQLVDQARAAMGLSPARSAIDDWARAHIRLVRTQHAEALRAVTEGGARLVFLHLAVPHWPWIYSRRARTDSILAPDRADGYLDNLALADSVLGEIVHAIRDDGRTTLVVIADHPYNPPPWPSALPPLFVKDPRVPFIVKLPGPQQSIEYDRPTNTLLLSTMTMRILEGRIRTVDDLRHWLDAAGEAIADSATAFQR